MWYQRRVHGIQMSNPYQPLPSPGVAGPTGNVEASDLEKILGDCDTIYVKGVQKFCCCVDATFTYFKGTMAQHDENAPIMTLTVPFPSIMQIIGCAQTSDLVCPMKASSASGSGKLVSPPALCPVQAGGYPWLVFNESRYVGKFTFGVSCLKCEKIVKDGLDNRIYGEDECCLMALVKQCMRNCCRIPIICPRICLRVYKAENGTEVFAVYRILTCLECLCGKLFCCPWHMEIEVKQKGLVPPAQMLLLAASCVFESGAAVQKTARSFSNPNTFNLHSFQKKKKKKKKKSTLR
eukprot:TRINITY_DN2687_c0_g3_i2.p1 TRINITY_DN2687_c0_g3~~TRINITY_DN2687_c0_g3_i2.p1  ORF type:complete len:293 (+),score=29.49 TRINITY_DN2687_c0_g3_i2:18-896(+)